MGTTSQPETTDIVPGTSAVGNGAPNPATADNPGKNRVEYSGTYPISASDEPGYPLVKTGPHFRVSYHSGDEADADLVLAILEQGGVPLYQDYLGLEPSGIPVYLCETPEEYIRVSQYPGGIEEIQTGSGSALVGTIVLYKPFGSGQTGHAEGLIVHEGTHAVLSRYLGSKGDSGLPDFLNEGLAHYLEYTIQEGPSFDPLVMISGSNLLIEGAVTGNPNLMTLDQLGRRCGSYGYGTVNFVCRGEGTFTVWYVREKYGDGAWKHFIARLNASRNWEESLSTVTGKTMSRLGNEILDNLTVMAKRG